MGIRAAGQEAGHAPRLQPVWLVAVLWLVTAAVAFWAVYFLLDHSLVPAAAPGASDADRSLNVLKAALTVATFAGAVLAGVYAYRKQRLAEGDARRADAEQLTGRFVKASEQLGQESPAVRLAGVYAMTSLADDWPEQRQLCINVLTAYLQIPYEADPTSQHYVHGEKVVRRTILRVIRDHLRPGFSSVSWQGNNFRFEEAIFYGGDLTGARFMSGKVSFHRARFLDGEFFFDGAVFGGARIWFTEIAVEGGVVSFNESTLDAGLLNFTGAVVTDGVVTANGFKRTGGELVEDTLAGTFDPAVRP
ncbi:pentapeptide repeat-containing protein [Actinoplanes sp. DH11]|uniref:pentapeptide repeat-containing protein n=1 Tax=Actinoplanes sp. DH11 TaxID=2857011 RepID=UPI001E52DAA3|nr:pentapeptide repeat-containing protein [Actinoplanes sp. DH11]